MARQPKLRIENFANVGPEGPFYLECLHASKVNGTSVLEPALYTNKLVSTDTTGFSSMTSRLISFTKYYAGGDRMLGYGSSTIYDIEPMVTSNSRGKIHTVLATGRVLFCNYGDIHTTSLGNILYTSANHLGIAYRRVATGATSTSITVTGTDFTALGVTAGNNSRKYVYNVTKGEEYIVTSISGTGNITINFATAAITPATGDVILAFIDDKWDFGTNNADNEQFFGQSASVQWQRQIILWNDEYWMVNGNYLSTLDKAETTFQAQALALPTNVQATCISINQDKLFIGGDFNDKGKIMLYSAASNDYLSIYDVDLPISSCDSYGGGWIMYMGNSLYFTDGYTIKLIDSIPGSNFRTPAILGYNFTEVVNEKIFVSVEGYPFSRQQGGVWVFEVNSGWYHIPTGQTGTNRTNNSGSIFSGSFNGVQYVITNGVSLHTAYKVFVDGIYSSPNHSSATFYLRLPSKMKLGEVELNLGGILSASLPLGLSSYLANITVNYSDASTNLYVGQGAVGTGSTTTAINNLNGNIYGSAVGQMIIIDGGAAAGERSYIAQITNGGTTNEILTISPALSTTPTTVSGSTFTLQSLRLSETKQVDMRNINKSLRFTLRDIYTDNLFIEVVMDQPNNLLPSINGINIY